jgi:hypothetical protein
MAMHMITMKTTYTAFDTPLDFVSWKLTPKAMSEPTVPPKEVKTHCQVMNYILVSHQKLPDRQVKMAYQSLLVFVCISELNESRSSPETPCSTAQNSTTCRRQSLRLSSQRGFRHTKVGKPVLPMSVKVPQATDIQRIADSTYHAAGSSNQHVSRTL